MAPISSIEEAICSTLDASVLAVPEGAPVLRCERITRDQAVRYAVNPQAFTDPAEEELYRQLEAASALPMQPGSVDDFFWAFLPLIPVINRFFESVLVMAEDEQVRANRLGLLQRVAALADGVADFSRLEGF